MSDGNELVPAGDAAEGSDGELSVEMLAAALRQDTADLNVYARVLSTNLADSLPQGSVQLEYKRSMSDRMAGRAGTVVRVDVALGDQRLALRMERDRVIGEVCREVRGVVLSRQEVGLDSWVEALAEAITSAATSNARARATLQRFVLGGD
jgi:hypothetical protein